MTGPPWLVPAVLHDPNSGEAVQVTRAWPDAVVDGLPRVVVEGRDAQGRLRAGRCDESGGVWLLRPGQDRRLPGLAEAAARGALVVHRAGRRGVVATPTAYLKVVRPGRAGAVAQAASAGAELALAVGLAAPRVLDRSEDTVALTVLPGSALHGLSTAPDWERAWQQWARAWCRVQDGDAAGLPVHTGQDEAEVLRTWRQRASATRVLGGTRWADRSETVERLLRVCADPPRWVPSHRDLHDKQLLWDGDRLGVLDFDTACTADPALDLANLAVHADLRRAQGLWSAPAASVVRDAARSVAEAQQVDPSRWQVAQLATVVRLVAVYAFRPTWRDTVLAWAHRRWAQALADENLLIELSSPSQPAEGS